MLTSTNFHDNKSSRVSKMEIRDLQTKKAALLTLESILKKRINEFKELCLKEGELTGQLPIDYPLHPREPIPQIRKRTNDRSNFSNLNNNNGNVMPPQTNELRRNKHDLNHQQATFAIAPTIPLPARPTSTNSTSSSISTASSNTRSVNNPILHPPTKHYLLNSSRSNPYIDETSLYLKKQPNRFEQTHTTTLQFKRPYNNHVINPSYDSDSIAHVRANSTASSSSSSGSAASSTLSASNMPDMKFSNNMIPNVHARSYSEKVEHLNAFTQRNLRPDRATNTNLSHNSAKLSDDNKPGLPPPRPPRNPTGSHNFTERKPLIENKASSYNDLQNTPSITATTVKPQSQHFNINRNEKFQPYYEETKPFQMSDFYKYSSKHKQIIPDQFKTTRQLQEEAANRNSPNFSLCDDQLQASVKLIERSGQKLIEATARALANNPTLAEKLNNILPTK